LAAEVKPRSNRLLMVMGIVVAVVAFLLVIFVGGNRSTNAPSGKTQAVVVAAVDIPVGTQISDQVVKVVQYPVEQVPLGYHDTIRCPKTPPPGCVDVVNEFAAVAISKNTPLTDNVLVVSLSKLPPVKKPYLDIPSGQVALSIPAGGELVAVGGFIQPDDRVDVLASGLPDQKAGSWKAVIQNLRIVRTGGVTAPNTQGLATSYIVYVSLDDAENLSYLFTTGTYKFVLKSQLDSKPEDKMGPATSPGATKESFNSKYAVPK
jgi:pilus assembly protein CpaB